MKKLLMAAAILGGCATNFAATPTSKLCLDYLTHPSYNVWHSARAEELARRGESCGNYTEAAEIRRRANADADAAILNAIQITSPPTVPAPIIRTYILNGRVVTCTTNGEFTTCN